jgi:hypothetical protein
VKELAMQYALLIYSKPGATDGPFADTKEIFAGFYLLKADDLDRATEIAARIPAVRLGGSVEIRPVVTDLD